MRRVGAAALCLIALAACSRANGAVSIEPGEIPFAVARSAQQEPDDARRADYPLSFILHGRLRLVTRNLSSLVPAESVLVALLDGPTSAERKRGFTTAIPRDARLLQIVAVRGVAEVNLSREFQTTGSSQTLLLRVAQVVRTVTSVKGIRSVVFLIDGIRVDVPTDRGIAERPVTSSDYASVAPRPSKT